MKKIFADKSEWLRRVWCVKCEHFSTFSLVPATPPPPHRPSALLQWNRCRPHPGVHPKRRLKSVSVILTCITWKSRLNDDKSLEFLHFPASSHCNPVKSKKERKHSGQKVFANSGYQQPTVSSTTRILSPYTHRKMCELSEDPQQRLRHLHLGPHHFRKETESQQPFLVGIVQWGWA